MSMDAQNETKVVAFTDLKTWQKAHAVVIEVYRETGKFPNSEQFGLILQMRRCAVSITSNIAEGFARNTAKDKSQFYAISRGSVAELQNQLLLSRDLGYITEKSFEYFDGSLSEILRMLSGLMKSAQNR